jgi:hypothetical protein
MHEQRPLGVAMQAEDQRRERAAPAAALSGIHAVGNGRGARLHAFFALLNDRSTAAARAQPLRRGAARPAPRRG